MIRIPLDQTLRDKLRNLTEPLELCDEAGVVVARVYPVADDFEPREPQVSEEELDRREKSDKWWTTAELLEHLRKLP